MSFETLQQFYDVKNINITSGYRCFFGHNWSTSVFGFFLQVSYFIFLFAVAGWMAGWSLVVPVKRVLVAVILFLRVFVFGVAKFWN